MMTVGTSLVAQGVRPNFIAGKATLAIPGHSSGMGRIGEAFHASFGSGRLNVLPTGESQSEGAPVTEYVTGVPLAVAGGRWQSATTSPLGERHLLTRPRAVA